MDSKVKKISIAGLLIAISIVFSRFLAGDMIIGGLSVLRISFGPVPIYLSGIILGPVYGAITGAVADALGYLVKPLGPYTPGFTFNAALAGLLAGLITNLFKDKGEESWWRLFLIIAPLEIITSVLLTPLWLSMITGKAFIVFIPSNLISRIVLVPVYVTLVKIVLRLSKRAIPSLK